MRTSCVVCGDPRVVAKERCDTCRRYLNRNGTDRTEAHVVRLTQRDIEQGRRR